VSGVLQVINRSFAGYFGEEQTLSTLTVSVQFSSVYLIPFKQLQDRIQTQFIRTWMEKD